jgi:hypothetical protein
MDNFSDFFIGAYATSPTLSNWDSQKEIEYIGTIKKELNPIRGLELPFWGNDIHEHDSELFLKLLDKNWEYVLTCLPGNMKALENNKFFGLASDNEQGRLEAVKFYKKASEVVRKINNYFKSKKVINIAIATSPSLKYDGVLSSSQSLKKSLIEISKFDWDGAKLNIEHCDSGRVKNPVKGFLDIDEEIEAILEVNRTYNLNIGITINWARSVIEYKDTNGALKHIKKAKENNLLKGLIFSGTSDKESLYGKWSDLHLPIAKEANIKYFESTSLLNKINIKNSLISSEYKQLDYLGIKVLAMPIEYSSLKRRIGINYDIMKVLNQTIKEIEL